MREGVHCKYTRHVCVCLLLVQYLFHRRLPTKFPLYLCVLFWFLDSSYRKHVLKMGWPTSFRFYWNSITECHTVKWSVRKWCLLFRGRRFSCKHISQFGEVDLKNKSFFSLSISGVKHPVLILVSSVLLQRLTDTETATSETESDFAYADDIMLKWAGAITTVILPKIVFIRHLERKRKWRHMCSVI